MTPHAPTFQRRAIRLWLVSIAALIFAIVLVGGATRLTESGLSIVEWRPVTGMLPPLNAAAWQAEFEKYQAIPQYRLVNHGMSLAEFQTIFWWEWAHRLLARLVGAAFLLPFLWFLWRGWIDPALRTGLWLLFGLGALQGAVGWWMVASGLSERTEVSQYRLAAHLVLPCLIFVATIWTAQRLAQRTPTGVRTGFRGLWISRPDHAPLDEGFEALAPPRVRAGAIGLVALTLLQIYFGALLAGLRGGLIYNTWPLIEGRVIPPAAELGMLQPGWRNVFENVLTVQFDHRMTAYLLFFLALLHAADVAATMTGAARAGALMLVAAVTVQASLGILTLLHQVPIALALAHQGMAIIVLAIAAIHAERLWPARTSILGEAAPPSSRMGRAA